MLLFLSSNNLFDESMWFLILVFWFWCEYFVVCNIVHPYLFLFPFIVFVWQGDGNKIRIWRNVQPRWIQRIHLQWHLKCFNFKMIDITIIVQIGCMHVHVHIGVQSKHFHRIHSNVSEEVLNTIEIYLHFNSFPFMMLFILYIFCIQFLQTRHNATIKCKIIKINSLFRKIAATQK